MERLYSLLERKKASINYEWNALKYLLSDRKLITTFIIAIAIVSQNGIWLPEFKLNSQSLVIYVVVEGLFSVSDVLRQSAKLYFPFHPEYWNNGGIYEIFVYEQK